MHNIQGCFYYFSNILKISSYIQPNFQFDIAISCVLTNKECLLHCERFRTQLKLVLIVFLLARKDFLEFKYTSLCGSHKSLHYCLTTLKRSFILHIRQDSLDIQNHINSHAFLFVLCELRSLGWIAGLQQCPLLTGSQNLNCEFKTTL